MEQREKSAVTSYSTVHVLWAASFFYMLIATVVDYKFSPSIFTFSSELSVYLQSNFPQLTPLSRFLSNTVMTFLTNYSLIVFLVRKSKRAGLIALFINMNLFFVGGCLKMLLMDTRPVFEHDNLNKSSSFCATDFGKPSGHALKSAGFAVGILYDVLINSNSFYVKLAVCIGVPILHVLIMMSRIFFGVHSINQLYLGSAVGIFIGMTVIKYQKVLFEYFFNPILDKYRSPENRNSFFKVLGFLYGFIVVVGAAIFLISFYQEQYSGNVQRWRENEQLRSCLKSSLSKEDFLHPQFSLRIVSHTMISLQILVFFLAIYLSNIDFNHGMVVDSFKQFAKVAARFLIIIVFEAAIMLTEYPRLSSKSYYLLKYFLVINLVGFAIGYLALKLPIWIGIGLLDPVEEDKAVQLESIKS